ncbi:hypothetical protein [uncultured Roseobacter sp.]|uniref:hypothetical protein n=1 Tax=uncultured Roseobacter sp. TaxID=114847 RepID=UPI00263248D7|nr:hypothetical protein [uncultured Roseobacter sp.]
MADTDGKSTKSSLASHPVNATGEANKNTLLTRHQELIGVNRHDLEDLLKFDTLAVGLGAFGMFLLSGAVWLGVEKFLEAKNLPNDPSPLAMWNLRYIWWRVPIFWSAYACEEKVKN